MYGVRIVIFTADLKYTECCVRSDGNGKKLYFRDHCRACGNISLWCMCGGATVTRRYRDASCDPGNLGALNIVGDLLFVVVLKSGVRGAAIATVLAQAIAFVVLDLYGKEI